MQISNEKSVLLISQFVLTLYIIKHFGNKLYQQDIVEINIKQNDSVWKDLMCIISIETKLSKD